MNNNKLKVIRYLRDGREYLMIKGKELMVKGKKTKKDVLYYQDGNIL